MSIHLSTSMIATGNQLTDARRVNSVRITQAANGVHSDLAELMGEVALGFGALTNRGWCHIKNLSHYGTVTIGPKISGTMHKGIDLAPGEFCVFRLDPAVPVSASANQTCVVEWTVAES